MVSELHDNGSARNGGDHSLGHLNDGGASLNGNHIEHTIEPIAVIGLSLKFPGAASEDAFWDMLMQKRCVSAEFPKDRINIDKFHNAEPDSTNKMSNRGGHFLEEDFRAFDAQFFSVPPVEAATMDPQQRGLLETTYRALENSGIPIDKVRGSRTSVHVGSFTTDFQTMSWRDTEQIPKYSATGTAASILSSRISWFYDLKGSSLTVDTACSSGMVALDLSCSGLWSGESDMGIVAGSSMILSPEMNIALSNMNFLSPDSRCYSFDSRANGYARGEGFGVLILKRVSQAIRDGDPIRALIRATGVNQDGHTSGGVTQPSKESQVQLIRETYSKAGLDPKLTRFFEAHGTGTAIGDPIEAGAIGECFKNYASQDEPLYIGAVKSNIGHLEGASGIAGVIKAILALERGTIPPNSNFESLNPNIHADSMNIKFPLEGIQWPGSGIRRASVNSFGFGGTNAHAVLEDPYNFLLSRNGSELIDPTPVSLYDTYGNGIENGINGKFHSHIHSISDRPKINGNGVLTTDTHTTDIQAVQDPQAWMLGIVPANLLVWSAADEFGLSRMTKDYANYFSRVYGRDDAEFIQDLAFTLNSRRSLLPWRSFVVTDSISDLRQIEHIISKPVQPSATSSLAFVFSGQGAQWHGMGRELLVYTAFKRSLIESQEYLLGFGCDWLLLDEISKDAKTSRIHEPEFSQTLTTAIQIALVDLFRKLNVVPSMVVGHSSGEIAAAYCTGSLNHMSAIKLAYYRGVVASRLARSTHESYGMASIGLSEVHAQAKLEEIAKQQGFSPGSMTISCINSPKNVTISGPEYQIDFLVSHLKQDHIFARRLLVDVGYHSPQMNEIASRYLDLIEPLHESNNSASNRITMMSSVTCRPVSADTLTQGQYWVQNMVSPVNFLGAMRQFCSRKSSKNIYTTDENDILPDTLVEIGPHCALQGPIRDILQFLDRGTEVMYASALTRNHSAVKTFLTSLGQLHCRGISIEFNELHRLGPNSSRPARVMKDLPQYQFNHSVIHWDESRQSKEYRLGNFPSNKLLGSPTIEWNLLKPTWRLFIRTGEMPWVKDHQINGSILYPAAGMLVMAIEAINQITDTSESRVMGYEIRDALFHTPLVVPDSYAGTESQICLHPSTNTADDKWTWYEFRVYSVNNNEGKWLENCRGFIRADHERVHSVVDDGKEAEYHLSQSIATHRNASSSCQKGIKPSKIFDIFRSKGFEYGPSFQRLDQIYVDGAEDAVAKIEPQSSSKYPVDMPHYSGDHVIHPVILDGIFQTLYVALNQGSGDEFRTMLPSRIDRLWCANASNDRLPLDACSKVSKLGQRGARGHVLAMTADQQIKVEVDGLEVTAIAGSTLDEKEESRMGYGIDWKVDFDTMSARQIQEYCERECGQQTEPTQWRQDLEYAAIAFAYSSLLDLENHRPLKLSPSLERYVSWIQGQVDHDLAQAPGCSLLGSQEQFGYSKKLSSTCERLSSSKMGKVFVLVGRNLTQIILGEIDPLQLLFEDEHLLEGFFDEMNEVSQCFPALTQYLDVLLHKAPGKKILEIGAGTGATTKILRTVLAPKQESPRYGGYDFTDISPSFFSKAKEYFNGDTLMTFCTLDIEKDVSEQGFLEGAYDLIIAANVLHATRQLNKTLNNVRRLLKPGGKLVLFEVTVPTATLSGFVFGLLPGWWLSTEDWRQQSPCIPEQKWDEVLKQSSFSGTDIVFRDFKSDDCHGWSVMISTAIEISLPPPVLPQTETIVIVDIDSPFQREVMKELDDSLRITGRSVTQTLSLYDAALVEGKSNKHFIFLHELEHPVLSTASTEEFAALRSFLVSSASFLWVTGGGGKYLQSPEYGMVQGLCRVSRQEHTKVALVNLALDLASKSPSSTAEKISKVFNLTILGLENGGFELEYVEIDDVLHINRLVENEALNNHISDCTTTPRRIQNLGDGPPLQLSMKALGSLESLEFEEDTGHDQPLGPDEIEVKVAAVGVNFKECLTILGRVATHRLGSECSGIVTRVGQNCVNIDLQVGDRVCLLALDTYRTYARTHYQCAIKIPSDMAFVEAAAVPTAFCTAWYSLVEIGRLKKNESVLIHTASGGTGQAALQVAMHIGATIFATVGSHAKKELLMNQFNIPEENIFYSRDTSFARGIMRVTKNRGVDVILNSLSGDALVASWECIAPYGRFIEIGRKDIDSHGNLPMFPFIKNASFSGVDLTAITEQRPQLVQEMLQSIFSLISSKALGPASPLTVFSISDIEKAFRLLQSGKSSGKIVLEMSDTAQVPTALKMKANYSFRSDVTYVISGGLGGLGRTAARWLADRGAKHLLLLSRSGIERNEKGRNLVIELRARGVQVETPICDITNMVDLQTALEVYTKTMPPIKGCILSQMVIKDSPIASMTYDVWQTVVKPKVQGSWNMHMAMPKGLDFFIMLSSITGIFGNAGQSNYAAGNTYQDALAQHRISIGEKAFSLDVGCVLSEGYLAENSFILDHLLRLGLLIPMSIEELLAMLDFYCNPSFPTPSPIQAQILTGLLPPTKIKAKGIDVPSAMNQPIFRAMHQIDSSRRASTFASDASLNYRTALATAKSPEEAGLLISKELRNKLCRVVGLSPGDIDLNHRIESYGVDSLVSVELRNWLYKDIGADLAVVEIVGGATFISVGLIAAARSSFRSVV